jgi:hypothetical protein
MSNLTIFDAFGKIKKSTNWWLIGLVSISIIGIGFLIWFNWKSVKARFAKKQKLISTDFSATISFDQERNTLKVKTLSSSKQAFSMQIVNYALVAVYESTLTKSEEEFDMSILEAGKYKCVVSNQEKTIVQEFEKK